MSWGAGVDPSVFTGRDTLEQVMEGDKAEGQHMFPELADFMAGIPGASQATPTPTSPIEFTAVRYNTFNVMVEQSRLELEVLMTKLSKGAGCLVCKEDSFFTKDGQYIVVVKWAEYSVKTPPKVELTRHTEIPVGA